MITRILDSVAEATEIIEIEYQQFKKELADYQSGNKKAGERAKKSSRELRDYFIQFRTLLIAEAEKKAKGE